MIYGEGSKPEEVVSGLEAIKEKLSARAARNWVLSLESGSVDAQQSKDGGVLLMVTGSITSKHGGEQQPRQVILPLLFIFFFPSPNLTFISRTTVCAILFPCRAEHQSEFGLVLCLERHIPIDRCIESPC